MQSLFRFHYNIFWSKNKIFPCWSGNCNFCLDPSVGFKLLLLLSVYIAFVMLFFCDLCPLLCALFCFGSQSLISSLRLCCVTHYYPITTFYFSDAYNWFIFLLSDIKLISSQSVLFAFKISSFLLSNGYSLPNLCLVFWLSMIPFSYYPCYGHTINSFCVLSPTQKKWDSFWGDFHDAPGHLCLSS